MSKKNNVITEIKFFFDLEKEIEYINEMNKKGWKLTYIKGGILYTFVKTEPDEYITIMHVENKEKLSEVAAFAAQCGYENIPHTMDGIGIVMYLTGKKSEVSEDFVNDTSSKIKVYKHLKKIFNVLSVIFVVMNIILIAETFMIISTAIYTEFDAFITGFSIFMIAFIAIYTVICVYSLIIRHRYSKKVKELSLENNIYE